jgi:hypothetical protein
MTAVAVIVYVIFCLLQDFAAFNVAWDFSAHSYLRFWSLRYRCCSYCC